MYSAHGRDVRFRYGECAVARLPSEIRERFALGLDPLGRRFLHFLDGLANRYGAAKFKEQMDVIVDGINQRGGATEVFQYDGHVSM